MSRTDLVRKVVALWRDWVFDRENFWLWAGNIHGCMLSLLLHSISPELPYFVSGVLPVCFQRVTDHHIYRVVICYWRYSTAELRRFHASDTCSDLSVQGEQQ